MAFSARAQESRPTKIVKHRSEVLPSRLHSRQVHDNIPQRAATSSPTRTARALREIILDDEPSLFQSQHQKKPRGCGRSPLGYSPIHESGCQLSKDGHQLRKYVKQPNVDGENFSNASLPRVPRFGEWVEDTQKMGKDYSLHFQRAALRRHVSLGHYNEDDEDRAAERACGVLRLGPDIPKVSSFADAEKFEEKMVLEVLSKAWVPRKKSALEEELDELDASNLVGELKEAVPRGRTGANASGTHDAAGKDAMRGRQQTESPGTKGARRAKAGLGMKVAQSEATRNTSFRGKNVLQENQVKKKTLESERMEQEKKQARSKSGLSHLPRIPATRSVEEAEFRRDWLLDDIVEEEEGRDAYDDLAKWLRTNGARRPEVVTAIEDILADARKEAHLTRANLSKLDREANRPGPPGASSNNFLTDKFLAELDPGPGVKGAGEECDSYVGDMTGDLKVEPRDWLNVDIVDALEAARSQGDSSSSNSNNFSRSTNSNGTSAQGVRSHSSSLVANGDIIKPMDGKDSRGRKNMWAPKKAQNESEIQRIRRHCDGLVAPEIEAGKSKEELRWVRREWQMRLDQPGCQPKQQQKQKQPLVQQLGISSRHNGQHIATCRRPDICYPEAHNGKHESMQVVKFAPLARKLSLLPRCAQF